MIKDYYQELHIRAKAVPELINSSYKILKEKYKRDIHPDEIESWMTSLDEAYQVLSDPEKRKKYDQVYFQEYGGIADLEKRLNKHKGLLIVLSMVFVILIGSSIYFLYSIQDQVTDTTQIKERLTHQTKALKDDLESYRAEHGRYPNSSEVNVLRNTLDKYKQAREGQYWSKMKKYELKGNGDYSIIIDMGEKRLTVTPDDIFSGK